VRHLKLIALSLAAVLAVGFGILPDPDTTKVEAASTPQISGPGLDELRRVGDHQHAALREQRFQSEQAERDKAGAEYRANLRRIAREQAAERAAKERASRAAEAPPVQIAAPAPATDPGGDCYSWPRMTQAERVAKAHRCWDGLLGQYSWDQSTAFRIMMCESGGNPNAIGPPTRYGRAAGLMQILPNGSLDPATNMKQAWAKYQSRGWQPWSCR
jgi:hypothetical protein